MDFYYAASRVDKAGVTEIFPDFIVGRSEDLMVQAKSFYAIWDERKGLWSTDEYDVQRIVDEGLHTASQTYSGEVNVKYMRAFGNQSWAQFRKFMSNISDNSKPLNENLAFLNTEVKKTDYVSKRLPYPLEQGDIAGWEELLSTLYKPEEREKIEWAIGAIVAGDAKHIQKFLVLFGPGGTGKSTVLNIIQNLFDGYSAVFDAKALGSNNAAFATEVFKTNPLVAIQHDGDLSRIEDNTKLNSIISHEDMLINEKFKPGYTQRINAFLFMGTNKPVKITDGKSGIIRRLIDVQPTGIKLAPERYNAAMASVEFELGAIAYHCLQVYKQRGKHYYDGYRPIEMMMQTDVFLNFIEDHYDIFKEQGGTTLKQAYTLYREFCAETGIEKPMPQYRMRGELQNYFEEFHDTYILDGAKVRSYYKDFNLKKYRKESVVEPIAGPNNLETSLIVQDSIFDEAYSELPAQLTTEDGTPRMGWDYVDTTLKDIDTTELHYVKVPENHIIIDFDLKDEDGNKSLERNLEAAKAFPRTYCEISKSGNGVHLHYIYDGDVSQLAPLYSEDIEVKVYKGNSSLRRRLSLCNGEAIAHISSGLPIKEKKVLSEKTVKSEKGVRDLIERNLQKEIHPSTKSSIDFITKILDDAYDAGVVYDVTDMRPRLMSFANNSTNQSLACLKAVMKMKYVGKLEIDKAPEPEIVKDENEALVSYDIEVYPNLFLICWKYHGSDNVVVMVNPKAHEVEALFKLKLIGFNNRRYDNHILYGAYMGMDNQQLYDLSQRLINGDRTAYFAAAYNLSYADVYDYSSKKQSLKKFMVELGLDHLEMDIPWDEPVPEHLWPKVIEYCKNDVVATEETHKSRAADFKARQILAELSGLTVNHTTQAHTAKIIFKGDRDAQKKFIYTDLSTGDRKIGKEIVGNDPTSRFEGYSFRAGKSKYRDEDPSEGGYVYAEPGYYENVAVIDVASMHPSSIVNMELFGEYTPRFHQLMKARLAIKHGNYDGARKMLDGKLAPYLKDESDAKDLSYALKIVINIVYGLTSAKFDNPFRDIRNRDNIVAKRGALFMIDLKHYVQEVLKKEVIHIKTDSIKVSNASPRDIQAIEEFGKKYGYDFEHENTYDKFCLVNDAVYIAREGDRWDAVGAQFQHPYVFKSLFSGEVLSRNDFLETKQVSKGAIYLDTDPDRPMTLAVQTEEGVTEGYSHPKEVPGLVFIGRIGRFVPVVDGGVLYRIAPDNRHYAATGTKDYRWKEASHIVTDDDLNEIDMGYFEGLAFAAREKINQYVDFNEFIKH